MKNWALEAYLGSFNGVSLLLKKELYGLLGIQTSFDTHLL